MASTYEDMGPIPWYRTEQCIFYIVFFIVFPFFFVNIFVALIIVTFNELGEAELEDDMDKNQKSCIDFAIQAKPMQLYVPSETSGIRYCAFIHHSFFLKETFILQLPSLAFMHLGTIRELHPAPDHHEHAAPHAQVWGGPHDLCGCPQLLQPLLHDAVHNWGCPQTDCLWS